MNQISRLSSGEFDYSLAFRRLVANCLFFASRLRPEEFQTWKSSRKMRFQMLQQGVELSVQNLNCSQV